MVEQFLNLVHVVFERTLAEYKRALSDVFPVHWFMQISLINYALFGVQSDFHYNCLAWETFFFSEKTRDFTDLRRVISEEGDRVVVPWYLRVAPGINIAGTSTKA